MKIKISILGLVALCAAAFVPATPAHAQTDNALLDALVKKGVLSDQEAEDVRADEAKDYSQTGASKIVLSSAIKTIQFYGDLRLRYEMRDGTTGPGATSTGGALSNHGDSQTENRWRYRLRFGIKGELYDNFFYGIRAASNPNFDRSGNVTLGHSDAAGPFGKDQGLMGIDQVFLGWHATSDITLQGGEFPNPLYTTSMVWDDNLSPQGAAELYDHTFGDVELFGTAEQLAYQAGGGNGITNVLNPGANGGTNFSNTFMFVEQVGFKYKFDDNTFYKMAPAFSTYSGTVGNAQTGGTVAGLYSTSPLALAAPNNSPSFFNGPFVGAASAPAANVSGINDLAVLEVPMEFDFRIGPGVHSVSSGDPKDMTTTTTGWSLPVRFFADVAYNVDASARADAARAAVKGAAAQNFVGSKTTGNTGLTLPSITTTTTAPAGGGATTTTTAMTATDVSTNAAFLNSNSITGLMSGGKALLDQTAWQLGAEVGQLKKKGDWDGKLYWQSTGYYAVDPNLVDADIFNSATNLQGVVVSVAHNWTDGLTSSLRYAHATPLDGHLATPNVNQDLTLGNIREYNLFQADLMWKF